MSSVSKLQKKIYGLTSGLFATWLPDDRLDIGDYGRLDKGRFLRDGNLKKKGVHFEEDRASSDDTAFRYSDGAKIKSGAKASGSEAVGGSDLRGEIEFSKEGGFVYHFHDAAQVRIESRDEFLRSLLEAITTGKVQWQEGYVVVDELRDCSRYWIMVSEAKSGSVKLSGSATITESSNLASVGADVSSTVESGSILDYSNGKLGRPLYHAIKPVFGEGPTGGGGFQMMLKYFWSFFGERFPEPNEIDITTYKESKDTFEIGPRGIVAGARHFTVKFESATIEDLLRDSDVAMPWDSDDDLPVEAVQIQQYGQGKYEAGG